MSIKIRLSRGGRKKAPFYSIVATNSTSPRDSKFLEKLGTFNPFLKKDDENRVVLKKDRAEYWLSVGAQPSERVAPFLINLGVAGSEKYAPKFTPKEKYTGAGKKTLEKLAAAKEAAQEAAAQKIADEAAAKEAEEAAKAEAKAAKEAEKAAAVAAKAEAAKPAETPEVVEEAPKAEEKTEETKA
ncbi:MAG: small subunit ribosomal protein S16 [Rickettsiales bacterium]|jgi:small subunit ribosomal protein S16